MLPIAIQVSNYLKLTVVDMRFVKPVDNLILLSITNTHDIILTLEENVVMAGAGSAINEFLLNNDCLINVKVRNIGLPDYYYEHGDRLDILNNLGISTSNIISIIDDMTN